MKQRYLEFDYLRGIAILLIILGHAVVNIDRTFPLALNNLIAGGSGVFVFVSGFFFHRVFAPRFDYRAFMAKKIRNVFLPFLLVSLVALLPMMWIWLGKPGMTPEKFAENLYWQLNDGYVLYPHWYIPFIMAVFLLSPVYLLYVRASTAAQLLLLAEACIAAMLVHRPLGNINVLQSLVYFTPYYLAGILCSQHYGVLARHRRVIAATALLGVSLFVVLQTLAFPHLANYHKAPLQFAGIDLMFWQKLCLCLVLLEFARWLSVHAPSPLLLEISRASFALYFLHPFLLSAVHDPMMPWLRSLHPGALTNIAATGVSLLLATALTYAVALAVRRSFGQRSRMLIGW
ncbi:acyltransferase family protein [Marinobacterium aestuariivivens]|uniref:Acyltransferase n=1 Tax=Marinobacterium aestuariivivens TaxID=1698799 RepID=A0ABW2A1Q8_9GAMM